MPVKKYNTEILIELYNYLRDNPMATYEEIERHFSPQKINANSLVKRLQRMGCVSIERYTDPVTGKIKGSRKVCKRSP